MKIFLFILLIFNLPILLFSQPYKIKNSLFNAKIITQQKTLENRVNLISLTDSSVFITKNSLSIKDIYNFNYNFDQYINIEDIKKMKIRRQGNIGTGLCAGALFGLFTSILIVIDNSASGREYTLQQNILATSIVTVTFSLAGGMIGSINRKYYINYSYNNFQNLRSDLEQFTIENNFIEE